MKILVVSDNHGDRDCLVDLVNHYEGQVDALFHCGDSELEPTDELWQKLIVVQGNCDFYDEFPKTVTKKVGDQVIYMTHGHLANVRMYSRHLLYKRKKQERQLPYLVTLMYWAQSDTITFSLLIREVFVYLVDQFKRKHMP